MTIAAAGACDACLRRGALLGALAPRIQAVLDSRQRRPAGLLALGDDDLIAAVGGRDAGARRLLREFDVGSERTRIATAGLTARCRHAPDYPEPLGALSDPPAVLYVAGRATEAFAALRDEPAVAVVGSRRASAYGLEMSREMGRGLAAVGVTVVSGLALGIDAAAHEGCLAAGGLPVAVLGGGADVPYPHTNRGLYRRIREHGAVLSEMPPGQRPLRWGFPARNRIMAGMTRATLVVEAARRSGSLITTDYAVQLGRLVAAVPGRANQPGALGSNDLLRDGAPLIGTTRDLLDELFGVGKGPVPPAATAANVPADPLEATALEAIDKGWPLDRVCSETGAGIAEVRRALSRLEAHGRIVRDDLGVYRVLAPEPA